MCNYGVYRLVSSFNNTRMIWDNIAHIAVSVLIAVFFSLYIDKAGIFVDKIINSCENGAPWVNDACDCTDLPFTGKNCQTSTCANGFAVYDLNSNPHTMNRLDSLWACYCKGKWSGYNCEVCNTDLDDPDCSGPCKDGYHGAHCQNTCFSNLTQDTRYLTSSLEGLACVVSEENGGVCSYCSKQGTCTSAGKCKCNAGYFDYNSGGEVRGCALECPTHNGTLCSGHGECQSTGLVVNCNCQNGYTGDACQYACLNECSGIGTCVVSDVGTGAYCSCPDRARGEYCQHICPGKSICSGRGTCDVAGKCTCDNSWGGDACNCQNSTTCGGHGHCQPSGACVCDKNWDCTVNRCLRDQYGVNCDTLCTATSSCNGHGACDNFGACKCDLGWVGKHCDNCEEDVFPKPGGTDAPCTVYITRKTCHNHGYPNYMYKKSSKFSGMCICDTNFDTGSNCDKCTVNWYGENCAVFCNVDQCNRGRCSDQGTCICEDGWFGKNCDDSCGGEVICSGHGTCVADRWTDISQKCQCEEGYSGINCDTSAPMSSGSICNGRGAAIVHDIEHTGITFGCNSDVQCGDFSVLPPDFSASTLSVAFQMALTQAVWGVLGPEQPYGPVCSLSKSPDSLLEKDGSVGQHAMTEWSPDDITDGPFYVYNGTSDEFVYPLFRTTQTNYEPADTPDGVTLYGRFVRENSVECEHLKEPQSILAGCTWLESGFCNYAMQGVDAADWCYRHNQYEQNKCPEIQALPCHVDNCSVSCGVSGVPYNNSAKAINEWNSKHMHTPFDGEDLIGNSFTITDDMYWGDMPNYNATPDCQRVLDWDIPIKVNNTPRWWCQYGDIIHTIDVLNTPSEDCQEIDKTIAGFEGFFVNGVQYDTFKEAVSVLNYPDTIVYGKHYEYAEIMSIDDMCQYYNSSSEETWGSDGVGEFNGAYTYLEYSFTLANFSRGTTVAFVNETVDNTNYLAIIHDRRLQMVGGPHGLDITTGPELELDTKYRIRLDFGENVTCTDMEGVSCPAPVSVVGELAGMRAVEGGTRLFAMHAYQSDDILSKTNSWKLRMPPGWKANRSIWKLCNERHDVLVRSRPLCEEQKRLYTHETSSLTRQETVDCVAKLDSCPLDLLDKTCKGWEDLGSPNASTCDDPGNNPTSYDKCNSDDSNDWDNWCKRLKNDTLPGKCALMQCECNMDTYLGIAGSACQLTCPVNSDTGTACGYQEPPGYPYGKCKEIDETNEPQTPRTVTQSTCECTRSRSESCEEKCDAADTPDCNPKSSKETMRSFDCWGFGSEVSYDHRLSLVSYQRCAEYLQHHPASENPAYNVPRPVGVGTGLCRWTDKGITWGGTEGNLIDTLVTSEEDCKALNAGMGLFSAITDSVVGTNQSSGIVFADNIVMKPIVNGIGDERMYDIVFEGDTSKLDMTKGSKVSIGGTIATVYSSTQVLSSHNIADRTNLVYGGATLDSLVQQKQHELWRFKSNIIVPTGSDSKIGNASVYEISNNYIYTLAEPSGNIEVTLRLLSQNNAVSLAGYILKLPTPVNGLVDGTIPVKLYGNSIYSPKLTNRINVTIWTGNMFDIVILKVQNVTEVDYGDSAIAVGDKLGESVVVSDNVVTGTPGNQWYSHILKTQIENATLTGEKICRVTCPNCTESVGMLLTQNTTSTGLIYKKTGTVFHIITTSDWVDDTTYPACNVLTSITVRDPLITKHNAELHQGDQKGEVWDRDGHTLTVVGNFEKGDCDFFQPAVEIIVDIIGSNGWYVITATTSVPVEGVIMQVGRNGTVETRGNEIRFVSNHVWTTGKAVQGKITTVSCSASPVHLIKIFPIYIVATGTLDGKTILEPLDGKIDELLVVNYTSDTSHSIIVELDATPVHTGMSVYEYTRSTSMVNVGDVAYQATSGGNLVGVVANTNPLKIESSDTFSDGTVVFGSPFSIGITVKPSNNILNTGGKWCSQINGVHVWGKGDTLAQRVAQRTGRSTSVYDGEELKKILEHHPNSSLDLNCSGGCSYDNEQVVEGRNIGNDLSALVTSKEECRGYLDYHPAETLLDTGGPICSFSDTVVSWGPTNIGIVMGMPTGTVHLGISECQGGICMCKPPKNAYFYKSRTSVTGKTVKIRHTKYFGRHKGTNLMQGPQQYLINHAKHNNEPITEENWEVKYDIWILSKSGFVCSNPKYAGVGETCDSNTICIDTVCGGSTCSLQGIDSYVGEYKYEQCLVDSLLLSERQETSAYMGLLCNEECPSITEYGTPCSGHGTCSRTGACTCEIARTMVKYTQNTRKIIKNNDGKPLISFMGQESLKMEERTGWRGDGCELMCPGYDAVEADMTGICSGHGQCTASAKCICEIGYTGANCQLDCPNTKNLKIQCSGHGVCQPNTFNVSSNTRTQLNDWIDNCTSYQEQTLNTVTINGRHVSQLQFYENIQSSSQLYMDAEGKVFNVSNQIVTPTVMLQEGMKYPVRIVGTDITLVHDRFPRSGPTCESTMVTNQYKIRPQIKITRYNDKQNRAGAPICPEEEEVKQTCDVMSKDTLQCAMCACPPTIYNGFWGGSDCRTCMPGYGGDLCKKVCPGFDGTDLDTACGGIGTCIWGSAGGKGILFKNPTCTCGDDPNVGPGYEYCDLYVDGTSDQTDTETHNFKDKGGVDGDGVTCSCENGYSGMLCNEAMPTCLFGGDPNPDGNCNCVQPSGFHHSEALLNKHSCCPRGLDDTVLQSKLVPTYITDSMSYTTYDKLGILETIYIKDCQATCPYGGDNNPFSYLWDYIHGNLQDGTGGTEFSQCSGHGKCTEGQCNCTDVPDVWENKYCSCRSDQTYTSQSTAENVHNDEPMHTYMCLFDCKDGGGCICNAGYRKGTGQEKACVICPAGWFQDSADQPDCTECAAGQYQEIEGQSSCTSCAVGQYQGSTHEISCKVCNVGSVTNTAKNVGANTCTPCAIGKRVSVSGVVCVSCDDGKYQDEKGKISCKSDCRTAPNGGYHINTAKTTCTERWRIIAPTDNNGVCSAIGTGWGVPGGETAGDYPEKWGLCKQGYSALGVSSSTNTVETARETWAPTGCTGYCSGSGSSISCTSLIFNQIGSGYSTSSSAAGSWFHRLCMYAHWDS